MYPQLIQTLCTVLSDDKKDSPDLVLVPALTAAQGHGNAAVGHAEPFTYAPMLPEQVQAHELPADETFLDHAEPLLRNVSPRIILAIPPWLPDRELSREWRNAHPRIGLIEAFIQQVFHPPGPPPNQQLELGATPVSYRKDSPDVLILFVPRGIMESRHTGDWRSQFFKQHATTVIEHDHHLNVLGFGWHFPDRVRAVTVVLQKVPGPLRFFKIDYDILDSRSDDWHQDLKHLLTKQGGVTKHGYVYRGEVSSRYGTTFDFYSPATQRLRDNIKDFSNKVSLEEVSDILLGFHPMDLRQRENNNRQQIQYISGINILPNGEFDLSELRSIDAPENARRIKFLEEGDICVRRIRNPRGPSFIAAVFPQQRHALAFDQSIIVIRPKAALSTEQRMVILAYLRSPMANQLFKAKGSSIALENHVLREFPVPLADGDIITAIQGLTEARNAFAEWTAKLDQDLSDIIVNRDLKESLLKILNAGQLARQRYRAARQVEELDYRIRTQYPLPLAYLWRDWQVSSPDHYRSLRNILKAAEGFTCFFALIALLAARVTSIRIGYIEQIAGRLADRGGGTNFGDWFAILKEVGGSKKFREQSQTVPFFEVTEMMRSEEFEKALRLLMKVRNDDSHGRINPNAVPASLLKELEEALTLIYDQAGFVSDFSLMQIKRTRLDSIKRITRYEYAELKGDNPLVPMHKGETQQTELEIDSLYLCDRAGLLHLFRPYLHYLECPECHLMSTFYLDTYPGSGPTVGLKSFERNSTRTEDLAAEFQWTGLLKGDN